MCTVLVSLSASIEDFTYDPTAQIEVSDILGKTIMNFSAIYNMYILINCFYIFFRSCW